MHSNFRTEPTVPAFRWVHIPVCLAWVPERVCSDSAPDWEPEFQARPERPTRPPSPQRRIRSWNPRSTTRGTPLISKGLDLPAPRKDWWVQWGSRFFCFVLSKYAEFVYGNKQFGKVWDRALGKWSHFSNLKTCNWREARLFDVSSQTSRSDSYIKVTLSTNFNWHW